MGRDWLVYVHNSLLKHNKKYNGTLTSLMKKFKNEKSLGFGLLNTDFNVELKEINKKFLPGFIFLKRDMRKGTVIYEKDVNLYDMMEFILDNASDLALEHEIIWPEKKLKPSR